MRRVGPCELNVRYGWKADIDVFPSEAIMRACQNFLIISGRQSHNMSR